MATETPESGGKRQRKSSFPPVYGLANLGDYFVQFYSQERTFLVVLAVAFFTVGLVYEDAAIARWLGFIFAGYSAVANDSIQTIGTFIASNEKQKWWVLWLFIGGLFLLTVGYSWVEYGGDVSHQRLAAKGFEIAPESFSYLQVAAPLFLLVLTRMKMPVSTTFLLLSSFAASGGSIWKVLSKSMSGWVLAFVCAMVVWLSLTKLFQRWFKGDAHPLWRVGQWITTGVLWSVWLMQDAANIAVYLPRQLNVWEFTGFASVVFLGLGLLFFMRGEKVQEVVNEKSDVIDVRAATIIDLVYAIILYYFKIVSNVPMSTTWVFIGLLGGRELAMAIRGTTKRNWRHALKLLGKDLFFVTFGLVISLILAMAVNEAVRNDLLASVGL